MRSAAVLCLALLAGCADTKQLVIHEAKIVLRHSTTEPGWAERRRILEAEIQKEDPDGQ